MDSLQLWQPQNETCGFIELGNFLHYSLIPSVAIIVVLSCLERRVRRSPVDEKWPLLNRRCGIVVPLDLAGSFENRWSVGFAFGATANKVMILFSDSYPPLQVVPMWARGKILLVRRLSLVVHEMALVLTKSLVNRMSGTKGIFDSHQPTFYFPLSSIKRALLNGEGGFEHLPAVK